MLIKNSKSVGFQCCVCGNTGIHTMELFEYGKKQNIILLCPKCQSEVFRAEKTKKGDYKVDIPCPVCFTPHGYNISMLQFWNSEILSLKCSYENSVTLLLGDENRVSSLLNEVFEPFEPFEPSSHCLDDAEFGIGESHNADIDKSVYNNFLNYLRMVSCGFDEEFLSVEDVLDSSYIPDDDMIVIKFIIKICRLIEDDYVECSCGECDFGSTDVDTEISGNVLSIICNNCGRKIEIELDPKNIEENFSDIEFINIK